MKAEVDMMFVQLSLDKFVPRPVRYLIVLTFFFSPIIVLIALLCCCFDDEQAPPSESAGPKVATKDASVSPIKPDHDKID
jgi:hypothetical protein